ncbi:hypothetical protein AAM22_gp30 [Pantoea phage vB_PagM_AAM22]|nr:hypothetical protein AAM22_gp30 [Pantoea phage vB_PagM_AAM22]
MTYIRNSLTENILFESIDECVNCEYL